MNKTQIKKSKKFSPGIIGGSVVTFLPSVKNTFFIKHEGESDYLKDENGQYVFMDIDAVIDARFIYLTTFGEKEKEDAVNVEFARMKKQLKEKANEIIDNITQYENWLNGVWHPRNTTFTDMSVIMEHLYAQQGTNIKEQNKLAAESFFADNPTALQERDRLTSLLKNEDYDTLDYLLEFEFGKPLATFKYEDNSDMAAFVNLFGAANIDKTVEDKISKGSLFLKAKIKVEQSYYPEVG